MIRADIFAEIHAERERQDAKWGEQNHPIMEDDEAKFSKFIAPKVKEICDMAAELGENTWFKILREEFFEAFAEDTAEGQRYELVQVAAVVVSMIECIDRNASKIKSISVPDTA
jgi:hypothetical protein